jgi:hypothetical protein
VRRKSFQNKKSRRSSSSTIQIHHSAISVGTRERVRKSALDIHLKHVLCCRIHPALAVGEKDIQEGFVKWCNVISANSLDTHLKNVKLGRTRFVSAAKNRDTIRKPAVHSYAVIVV